MDNKDNKSEKKEPEKEKKSKPKERCYYCNKKLKMNNPQTIHQKVVKI